MTEEFRSEFNRVNSVKPTSPGEKRQCHLNAIAFARRALDDGIVSAFEDVGVCLWNISDHYAMLRDGHQVYNNHIRFHEFVKQEDSKYLFWLVNDATQRFTLEKEGYRAFWWDLYRQAVDSNPAYHGVAAFDAHRMALSVNPMLPHSKKDLQYAIDATQRFVAKSEDSQKTYYNATLKVLESQFTQDAEEVLPCCLSLLPQLALPDEPSNFICGEWIENANAFSSKRLTTRLITLAVNVLLDLQRISESAELYATAMQYGLKRNAYIDSRLNDRRGEDKNCV